LGARQHDLDGLALPMAKPSIVSGADGLPADPITAPRDGSSDAMNP
jgi:hypothetical protein